MKTETDKPEPVHLTGGERLMIAMAIQDYRSMWEGVRADPNCPKHTKWLAGLRMRQCLRIVRKMMAREGKAETKNDRAIRMAFEHLACKVITTPDHATDAADPL